MLAVGVYCFNMRETLTPGEPQPVENSLSLAAVLGQQHDLYLQIFLSDLEQPFASSIGAAIYYNPYRQAPPADRRHSVKKPRSGIVAGHQRHVAWLAGHADF